MRTVTRQRRYDLSSRRSIGATRRFVSSLLGLLVLTFNVLGAGAAPVRADGVNPLFAQALLDGRIVVCTAAGMVVMDRDGTVAAAAAGHADLCVYCLPLMHGGAKAPVALAVLAVPPPHPAGALPRPLPSRAKPTRLDGTASPRAPPLA